MSQKPDETIKVFMGLGLSEQKAKETLKNQSLCDNLLGILRKLGHVDVPQTTGTLLYHLASKCKPQVVAHLPMISQYIFEKKLDTTVRVEKALEFVANHLNNSVNPKELEEYCGVGVVVTPEEIEKTVEGILNQHKAGLLKDRYKFNTGPLMQQVRKLLPWADGKAVKSEVDIQVLTLLGPKTEQDLAPVKKKTSKVATSKEEEPQLTIADVMRKVNFHAPGDNYKTDGYISTEHTYKLLKEHLKTTGGKVRTRFPPEPNGILHIGHAKAININFGYAAVNNGVCFLRYDDTNPEKEEEKFFTGIRDIVEWLGYTPYKITHSSDYFNQLYLWAVQLIKEGLAYVCHQKAEEMKGFNPEPSKWRDRPIEESLQLFEDMKNGKIDEGQATLRLKITLEEGKLDPVAYRVRFTPHHRTGNQWCIYPTYDYTHCLCDSIENITHSLCTKEFQSRRSSYYWLCNALNIYCPVQWEYGRLNVNYTVVSKRKIAKLITEGIVKDWDDPRLFTLTALRRRGFPAEAINKFCAQLGVTGAQSTVDPSMLEAFIRDHLNVSAQRRMVVLNPLKVVIENYPHPGPITVAVPNFPQNPELGSHLVTFDKVIYIDRSDYLPEDTTKTYKRLTNNQIVGLRHAGVSLRLLLADVNNKTNQLERLVCAMEPLLKDGAKPKGYIHWVSDPHEVEVRQYSPLFKHKNPEDPSEVPGGFLTDCNLDSLKIVLGFADKTILTAKAFEKYQFERDGFYSVDPDSKGDKLVFNLTVGLKEDAGK